MPGNILATLQEELRKSMNSVADHVAGGGCLSTDKTGAVRADATALAYAKSVGVIEGLARAEREMLDLVEVQRKAEESDKEETVV